MYRVVVEVALRAQVGIDHLPYWRRAVFMVPNGELLRDGDIACEEEKLREYERGGADRETEAYI